MSEFEKWFKSKNLPRSSDWHSGAREGALWALNFAVQKLTDSFESSAPGDSGYEGRFAEDEIEAIRNES